MASLKKLLGGGDLRSIGNCGIVISKIKKQNDFDRLFKFLFHPDRIIVMRAADAIEKITINCPQYLLKHKSDLLDLFLNSKNKELKWHLAVIAPRLDLDKKEFAWLWKSLLEWARDKTNSRLVRVAAIQGLFEMARKKKDLLKSFDLFAIQLEKEKVPSINARIRNIRKEMLDEI